MFGRLIYQIQFLLNVSYGNSYRCWRFCRRYYCGRWSCEVTVGRQRFPSFGRGSWAWWFIINTIDDTFVGSLNLSIHSSGRQLDVQPQADLLWHLLAAPLPASVLGTNPFITELQNCSKPLLTKFSVEFWIPGRMEFPRGPTGKLVCLLMPESSTKGVELSQELITIREWGAKAKGAGATVKTTIAGMIFFICFNALVPTR